MRRLFILEVSLVYVNIYDLILWVSLKEHNHSYNFFTTSLPHIVVIDVIVTIFFFSFLFFSREEIKYNFFSLLCILVTGYILVVTITCGGAVLLITVVVAVRCLKAIQNRASSSSSSLALPIPLLSEEEQVNFNSNLDHSVPVSI